MQHSLCHRKCSKRTGGTGQGQATDLVIRYPGLMTELGKLLRTPLLQGTKLHSPQSLGCEPSKCRGGHPRWIHTSKQPPPRALAPSKFSTLFFVDRFGSLDRMALPLSHSAGCSFLMCALRATQAGIAGRSGCRPSHHRTGWWWSAAH